MNQLDFKGRTAIVTGGAQGIGLAIVRRLLDSGATVRIWDRDKALLDKTISSLPGRSAGPRSTSPTARRSRRRPTPRSRIWARSTCW